MSFINSVHQRFLFLLSACSIVLQSPQCGDGMKAVVSLLRSKLHLDYTRRRQFEDVLFEIV